MTGANGNTTSITTTLDGTATTETYSYDPQNRLTGYNSGTGISIGYEYDANHMRIVKSQPGNYRRYYWDRGFIVNEGTGSYGNITINATNVIGSDGIMARDENNVTALMLKNAHGDVSKIITTADDTIRDYAYDPFGNELGFDATDTNPFRYAGEYQDLCSGLIYLRNRYYDPSIGRFISEDPVKSGLNWYVYCENNPVNRIDPSGLDSWVFYDGEAFGEQAKTEAENLKSQYGTEVHLVDIWSLTGFLGNWNKMIETDEAIDGVSMLFHGSLFTIYLGEADGQVGQLTSSTQNVTPNGSSGYYVGNLTKASMKSLNVMSCNGGHLDYVYLQLLLRNITMFIWPIEAVLFLLGKERWGDRLAGTVVVEGTQFVE